MESVWDYPRPPRVEPSARRVRVVHGGATIADTTRAVREEILRPSRRRKFCEFKGEASYHDLEIDGQTVRDAAWYYPDPSPAVCSGRSAATL